jgi:hypothetical protein
MRRLESYGLAMTASYVSALLGGLVLLICGAASSLGVQGIAWAIVLLPGLGIPVGIWCLQVLHTAGVKAAFTADAPPAQLVVTTLVAVLTSLVGIGCAMLLVMRWGLLQL